MWCIYIIFKIKTTVITIKHVLSSSYVITSLCPFILLNNMTELIFLFQFSSPVIQFEVVVKVQRLSQ